MTSTFVEWIWRLMPLWLYLYWRYKNIIGNKDFLAAIEASKNKLNGLLATVAEAQAVASLKPHKKVIERFGWISFLSAGVMMVFLHKNSLAIALVGMVGMLALLQSFAMEWVWEHKAVFKRYFFTPYSLGVLIPFFLLGSPVPNTPVALSWIFAPSSVWAALFGSACIILVPYLFLTIVLFMIVGIEVFFVWCILRSLRLIKWMQPDFVDFIFALIGAVWVIKALK